MKYIILFIITIIFTINSAYAKKNCTEFRKFSKDYLKCIGGNLKNKSSNVVLDTENIKEKKYITDWFKKKK